MELVKISLKHGAKITFVATATGEKSSIVSTKGKITLIRGRQYYIPVNTNSGLDDHNVFKTLGYLNEVIDIRNIRDNVAVIIPIIHNTTIEDGLELGYFI
jgi:hypothetical protein